MAKTAYKSSRTLISLLQASTNQIILQGFTLENQNHIPLAPSLETDQDYLPEKFKCKITISFSVESLNAKSLFIKPENI